MKVSRPQSLILRLSVVLGLVVCAVSPAVAQFDISSYLPPGVSVANVTPEQFSQAVFNAARENPSQAPQIAAMSFESVIQAGRFTQMGGKQDVDPDGSSGDPTVQEWADMASDAAKRAAPNMAPQIDAAMAPAVASAQAAVASGAISPAGSTSGTSGDGGGGGPGGGAPPVPGGFGGGGGSSTSSAGY